MFFAACLSSAFQSGVGWMALFSSSDGAAIEGNAGMRSFRCRGAPVLGLWVVVPRCGAVFKVGGGIHTSWRLPDLVFTESRWEDRRGQTSARCAPSTIKRLNNHWRRLSTGALQFIYILNMSGYSLEGVGTRRHRKVPHRIEIDVCLERRAEKSGAIFSARRSDRPGAETMNFRPASRSKCGVFGHSFLKLISDDEQTKPWPRGDHSVDGHRRCLGGLG